MAPYDRNSGSNKTGQAALPHKNIHFANLSVNVIIHLEVKLNCNQILENTYLPKVSMYILTVLYYKNEQMDILLIPPQYGEN